MSIGMMVSSAVLILSLMVTAFKFVDWLAHADPRNIMWMGRLGLISLALASLPGLMALLAFQQWTGAMLLGTAMLLGLALFNWRLLLPRRRFRPLWVDEPTNAAPQCYRHSDDGPVPDAELARRAAIVLQDYLTFAGRDAVARVVENGTETSSGETGDSRPMSADEARRVLGLGQDATSTQIRAAHRRLMQLVHPDRGGTDYLATQINRARDVLLALAPTGKRGRVASKEATTTPADNGKSLRPSQSQGNARSSEPRKRARAADNS